MEEIQRQVKKYVHEYYWKEDINCARTMLLSLAQLFNLQLQQETVSAAIGLHGAGGYRAQCGLVEGGLMFFGVYGTYLELSEEKIVGLCYKYAKEFEERFKSLKCYDLRPTGFSRQDPPHMCEKLTCEAIVFAYTYIKNAVTK